MLPIVRVKIKMKASNMTKMKFIIQVNFQGHPSLQIYSTKTEANHIF